jgi:lipoprotein-anchoring transpeptidase ErfK/SrfK
MAGTWRKILHRAAIFGSVILSSGFLPSCVSNTEIRDRQRLDALARGVQAPSLYHWDDTVVASGRTSIRIQLSEQKAYISRGGQEVAWTYIATGRGRHATPPGRYRVTEKQEDKHSDRYGVIVDAAGDVIDNDATAGKEPIPPGGRFVGAPMPYWMRLTGYGIGMHAGHIPNPGHPASHGCIRLPEELAGKLFDVVDVGTEVTVR